MNSQDPSVSARSHSAVTDQSEKSRTDNSDYFTSVPAISLPKGGGAIKGMGEKFAANPVTGTGTMSVPIATSPGRSGFGPQLSLSYDSGAGNSVFGLGWNLSIPAITRKTDKGLPRYFDHGKELDTFILAGAEDLVPALVQDEQDNWQPDRVSSRTVAGTAYTIQRYRPRVAGLFARIERWTNQGNPQDVFWRSISKENITTWYGKDANSRIADPANGARIFSWLICESYDDKGNVIVYRYKEEDSTQVEALVDAHERNRTETSRSANRYLKRIQYGNHAPYLPTLETEDSWPVLPGDDKWFFEVVFDYGEHGGATPSPQEVKPWPVRADPFSSYRAGFEVRNYRLCQRVLMFHHFSNAEDGASGYDGLVRSTDFIYSSDNELLEARDPIYTQLLAVMQRGYKKQLDGSYLQRSLPPLEFTYSEPRISAIVRDVDPGSLENLPEGLDGARYQWVDFDGEGLSGILTEQGEGWLYKRNLSPINLVKEDGSEHLEARFAAVEQVASQPAMALANGAQFLDLAGDGRPDLVALRGMTPGFYERTQTENWETFVPFKLLPTLDWDNPNLKFVDLNGDGHSDILVTEDECFVWHPSLAEDGFGSAEQTRQPWDEEEGPRVVFADGTQSIYLADMSGDGLTDIVRIRNGEVCYWPNLGYGRFGKKVTMDNAPWFDAPDIFNQRRIQLADIDGSGTTDILYLGEAGVQIYFNQSGNGWADKQLIESFPAIDSVASVTVVDLLGNGTACLVWSCSLPGNGGRVMRYLDLMGGQKPHLLIKTVNNLGAETQIQYAPSTKFYLQDKLAGKPWVTKLPFPVHVVERVTVTDKWRQSRFSNTYSYHHGYFDGVEREFRGFGRVEQMDVEDFGTFADGNVESPYITDDQTLYQPPVKTITWFHTGAFLDRERILSQFKQEYFQPSLNGFAERELTEPDIKELNLSAEEWQEALRACKGMMLRQEVYELDVDALTQGEERRVKLFSTAFHNCHIQQLQPRLDNRHGVFLVTESEAITYHYEWDLRSDVSEIDPRIAHTLNLNIDKYGNVLQSVAVAYPRLVKHEDDSLPDGAEKLISKVQQERHLVLTENTFTGDVVEDDHYRLRLLCEVKTYELTGIDPEESFYYSLQQLKDANLENPDLEISYHVVADGDVLQKRLVEHVRMLYFSDDLKTPLTWREINYLGLPYETYKLAITDDLLTVVFESWQLTSNEVVSNLNDAASSGYLSGGTLNERFPDIENSSDEGIRKQYWVRSGTAGFAEDAKEHFYLPESYTNPFGQTTTQVYDARDLYVQSSTDPVGNTTRVTQFDFRVLAPSQMQDINNNFSQVYFDVLGLPTAMAVMGKKELGEETYQADDLNSFTDRLANPNVAELKEYFIENDYEGFGELRAREWLGSATARYVYFFGEEQQEDREEKQENENVVWGKHPACACSIVRERHKVEAPPIQTAFEYSDGMGAVLVKKVQAEPGEDGGRLRWIASGKTVLNNKGNPVKQYEPYFSENDQGDPDHRFEEPRQVGVTSVVYYDAVDRTVRTDMPDGTFSRVEFSPWHMSSFDANDTVLDSRWYSDREPVDHQQPLPTDTPVTVDQRAAWLAAQHANTPAITHLDSFGREVVAIAHNRVPSKAPEHRNHPASRHPWTDDEKYLTYTKLDIEGKPLWIQDARGNRVMEYINSPGAETGFVPCYDIAGNLLFQHSMDAGDRWMLMDAAGQPFYAWDENERVLENGLLTEPEQRRFHTVYDSLRRPVAQELHIGNLKYVIERFVYRDPAPDNPDPAKREPEAAELNLGGQGYQHYDPGGLITNERFDFKGNLREAQRQLTETYDQPIIDWDVEIPASEVFTQRMKYDALNRMVYQENWHRANRTDRPPAVYTPQYNQRGVLVSEDLSVHGNEPEDAIRQITYNAKGQRLRIQYGNGTITNYTYDAATFRLTNLRTTRTGGNRLFQDLHYTYDPVGNITGIRDNAQQTVYFDNTRVEPNCLYTYDALYRLMRAEGREHARQNNIQRDNTSFETVTQIPFPNSPEALQRYAEDYVYDSVGNILSLAHTGGRDLRWKRCYQYATDSNRLLATGRPGDLSALSDPCQSPSVTEPTLSQRYEYDTHGNMLTLNRTASEYRLCWDYRDMIYHSNLGGGGQVWYSYDADKQRARKRIERIGNQVEERLYLDGMELYRRWKSNTLVEEIETYHLFANEQRILLVENVLETDNERLSEGVLFRYQYSNHLGSAGLELDEDAEVISYEEYHPYGTTAYQATSEALRAAAKRYRYTGKERDEETRLSYHGARYYAPWLGRWTAADPIGIMDGVNIFIYVSNNPINLHDPFGSDKRNWQEVDTDDTNAKYYENQKTGTVIISAPGLREVWAVDSGVANGKNQYKAVYSEYHFPDDPLIAKPKPPPPNKPPTVKELSAMLDASDAKLQEDLASGTTRLDIALQVFQGVGKGLGGLIEGYYNTISGKWAVDILVSGYKNVKDYGLFVGLNLTLNPVTQGVLVANEVYEAFKEGDYEKAAEETTKLAASAFLARSLRGNPAKGGAPYGFKSFGQFRQFSQMLRAGLRRAGYKDVELFFQGSAVTGRNSRTGVGFDVNRSSDFDIGLASPSLLDSARNIGVDIKGTGTRTAVLNSAQIEALGLSDLQAKLSQQANRPVNFKIFRDANAVRNRGPSVRMP
ncbi:MAG: SpvB/TcaC N-terminal domain-containing protein [Cyanobacteria bacterium P01_H01_bin.21]